MEPGNDSEPAPAERVGESSEHLDISWKLDEYAGYPSAGAVTPGMIAAAFGGCVGNTTAGTLCCKS